MKQEGYNRLRCARTGGISADLLKLTAIITMLIDHIGAGILERLLIDGYVTDYTLYLKIYQLDSVLRIIGRISFPIFCFLLVEGYLHTRSRRGYAFRLLAFALLSEIPFDLLFSGGLNLLSQNVFWTLLIGLLVLWGMDGVREALRVHGGRTEPKDGRAAGREKGKPAEKAAGGKEKRLRILRSAAEAAGILLVTAAGMCAAALLKTDYSWRGVLLIAVIGLLMRDRLLLVIDAPCAFLLTEFLVLLNNGQSLQTCLETVLSHTTVFLSFILIWFYNGKRRRRGHRYFFYLFYPVHLLILFFCRQILYAL